MAEDILFRGIPYSPGGGGGTVESVTFRSGLSPDAASTADNPIGNLGQVTGAAGDPGKLLHFTEIPLNGFQLGIKSEAGRTAADPNLFFINDVEVLGELTFDDPTNIYIGVGAGSASIAGVTVNNTVIGAGALEANSGNSDNVIVGYEAANIATDLEECVIIGSGAGAGTNIGYQSVVIGFQALANNPTTLQNTAIGAGALYGFTAEGPNDAIGTDAGSSLLTGINNVLFGQFVFAEGEGSDNVIIGNTALNFSPASTENVIIGSQAVPFNTLGNDNVLIGFNIQNMDSPGSNNVLIGANISSMAGTIDNAIVIGSGIVNILDNIVILGRDDQNVIIGGAIDGSQTDSGDKVQVYETGETVLSTIDYNGFSAYDSASSLQINMDILGPIPILSMEDAAGNQGNIQIDAGNPQVNLTAVGGNTFHADPTTIQVSGTVQTLSAVPWDLGAYTAGANVPTGYLTVTAGGVTYQILAQQV